MLHVQCGKGDDEKDAVNLPESNGAERRGGAGWRRSARIAAGFVVGILLVWWWQEQGKIAEAILAAAAGVSLGVVAFSLDRRL